MKISTKSNAPKIAGITAFSLGIVKLIAGILSGSMAVLSSAIDSMMDCLVSLFNYFAIKKADEKATQKFNYGFGKIEALMATAEGVLIILIGVFIFYNSIQKISANNHEIDFGVAFWVMIFSVVVTAILIAFLNAQLAKTNSLIIKADILHYKSDFYTNLGIIATLLIVKLTGFLIIDCIVGILISIYIIISALKLIKEGVYVLLDGSLESEIVQTITDFITKCPEIRGFHELRTRKSGEVCFFSLHLVFNSEISLQKAHNIGDEIENFIRENFTNFSWVIDLHFDPADDSKKNSL